MDRDQNLLGEALQRYLSGRYTAAFRLQTLSGEKGWSSEVWSELADLGLLGSYLAERHGGLAASPTERMGLLESVGRYLVIEPFISTAVIGGSMFSALDVSEAPGMLLNGSMRLALAADENASGLSEAEAATMADRFDRGYRLTGRKIVVRDAPSATHLIVSATLADSGMFGLFLVPANCPRIASSSYRLVDGSPAADLDFDSAVVPASSLLAAGQDAVAIFDAALNQATVAVCAEAIGVMRAMLEQTVVYTTQRKQFGVPLKNFQVLQHRMAEMYVEIEQACSSTHRAYSLIEDSSAVSGAKIRVNQALRVVSHESVQMHGAIGTTDELPLSRYFRRAAAIERQYGSTAEHIQRFEQRMLQTILSPSRVLAQASKARHQNDEHQKRVSS